MSEHQKEALDRVVKALGAIPEEHRERAADAIVHDISVMVRTIEIMNSAG